MIPTLVHVHHAEQAHFPCPICEPHNDPIVCHPADVDLWRQTTNIMLWFALLPITHSKPSE